MQNSIDIFTKFHLFEEDTAKACIYRLYVIPRNWSILPYLVVLACGFLPLHAVVDCARE